MAMATSSMFVRDPEIRQFTPQAGRLDEGAISGEKAAAMNSYHLFVAYQAGISGYSRIFENVTAVVAAVWPEPVVIPVGKVVANWSKGMVTGLVGVGTHLSTTCRKNVEGAALVLVMVRDACVAAVPATPATVPENASGATVTVRVEVPVKSPMLT